MNFIKICTVIIAVSFGVDCLGQSKQDTVVYYRQILNPTGRFSSSGDTIYEVSMEISNKMLNSWKLLTVVGENSDFTVLTQTDSISGNSRFMRSGSKTRVNMGEGKCSSRWIVVARDKNDKNVKLINLSEKHLMNPKEISTVIIPRFRSSLRYEHLELQDSIDSPIANSSTPQ